jgi:hypothetical protein
MHYCPIQLGAGQPYRPFPCWQGSRFLTPCALCRCPSIATLRVSKATSPTVCVAEAEDATHEQWIYVYIHISCVSVIVKFASSRPRSNAMNAPNDCVTEVTLHSSLPIDELYQRLHQHLPTSPYTQGAIYSPVRDALQVPYRQEPSAVLNTNSTESPPPAHIAPQRRIQMALWGRTGANRLAAMVLDV